MNVQDLGAIEGKLVLYGGPYSNLQATEALFAWCGAQGVGADHRICTGDTVAYCGDPAATSALIRDAGDTVVAGNCEKSLADGSDDCGCGFGAGTTCDLLSRNWYAHASNTLSDDLRAWMDGLPDIVTFTYGEQRCAVIHGGVSDISRFLWPSSPDTQFQEEIDLLAAQCGPVDMVFAGHCGIAFQRQISDVLWVNTGAIGLPPHDGRAETRFVVMDGVSILVERLHYDPTPAIAAMTEAGLTQGYHDALRTGHWPSEDVLPSSLRLAG